MSFLELNLFKHPSGAELDPGAVIPRLRAAFPEAEVLPGDQLAAEARRAEAFLAKELQANPNSPARWILESLRRKAQTYGPAYAFRISTEGGKVIKGNARRFNVTFLFDEPLPEDLRQRLIDFLTSFGVGKVKASTNDKRQSEVLCDMPGDACSDNGLPPSAAVVRPGGQPSESA